MDEVAPAAYNPHLQRVLKSFQTAAEASLSGPSRYMTVWTQQHRDHTAGSTWTQPHRDTAGSTVPVKAPQQITTELQHQKLLHDFRKAMLSSALNKKVACTGLDKSGPSDNSGYFPSGSYPVASHMGPVFLPMDSSHSEKSDTLLEGQPISCFIVGGEKRLCLPQILNTVLQDFTLQQINAICDDLHIFCSRCNPHQLDLLKMTGVLPPSAPSCGLITKTDAERLCNALLHGSPEKSREPPSLNSFKVYHECFGKCKGVFNPDLYTTPSSKCVDCCDCHGMFSPQKFVGHSHKALENRTCHWGFDSANWRAYLLLAKDNDNRENMQKALDDIKDKYDVIVQGYKKRRESPNHRKENDSKRPRYEENGKQYESWAEYSHSMSAFRPWSPSQLNLIKDGKLPGSRDSLGQLLPSFLQTGPPVLLNPERVIPFTDTKRYDRHFAPNVSLAPQASEKDDEAESLCKQDSKLLSSTSSYSASTSSMSALSSPSIVKVEKNPELDLSSSDESSFRSESVPSTPRDDLRHLAEVTVPCESELTFDRDVMLGLVKRAFEVTSSEKQSDEQEQILDQVSKIWSRQEDRIRALVQSRKHIIQEMELLRVSKQDRLQEMSESRYRLRQQVEQLQCEFEARSRDAISEKRKLKNELEMLKVSKHPEIASVKSKYKAEIEVLRGRLSQYEQLQSTMACEVSSLRQQLRSLGQEVSDLTPGCQTGVDLTTVTNGKSSTHDVMDWETKSDGKFSDRLTSREIVPSSMRTSSSVCDDDEVIAVKEEDDDDRDSGRKRDT